ncbi:MAG TPA: tRNA epoxyqueuosine(34) reductase QueG [Candidatus Sulfotelmatobacter sp.]|nr:tRNA epoxyqueuosine(34) reductase QueG [Candidatus Sulfotelmatobacter sp.]
MPADSSWIVEQAKALGFDLCGIVSAAQFPELEHFSEWLERGYAGEMKYLEDPRRREPELVMEDLRSVIVCGLNYNTAHPYSTEAVSSNTSTDDVPRGWISRYAWGDDYHEVLWNKLNTLTAVLKKKSPGLFTVRAFADTGPVAERVFAKHAGLGWLGKNTLLLNETLGSWLFLGVLFTSLELRPSLGPADVPLPDLCGNCRQCLDACPTGALVAPYVLDARRCISYLTIELRGSIPEEFREPMGWQVYGCDICQDVCPFNRAAPASAVREFQPRQQSGEKSLLQPSLEWLAGMSEEEFREVFRGSAVKRAKWVGVVRNACVALGNADIRGGSAAYDRIMALLTRLAESEISTIAESARWALRRIQ